MQVKKIIITFGALLITFILLFVIYKLLNIEPKIYFPEVNVIQSSDHLDWSPDKKNLLIEYSDFQCPACKNFHNLLKQFEASGSSELDIVKKITLIYRHYPLTQIHNNALFAAYAAEAAKKQGKFNEMSDKLFETQEIWSALGDAKEYFAQLAKSLNLNMNQYSKDLSSKEISDKVQADISMGDTVGINSTPTFFLNGKKLDSINSIDEFKQALRSL